MALILDLTLNPKERFIPENLITPLNLKTQFESLSLIPVCSVTLKPYS